MTAGDPAGVGLEVLLRSLPRFLRRARWVLFAESSDFVRALERFQPDLEWSSWNPATPESGAGLQFSPTGTSRDPVLPGAGSAESGRRALAALEGAAEAVSRGLLDGVATAPVSKRFVGDRFTGQTEFFRDHSNAPRVAMSFFTPSFKVVLATTHVSLRRALDRLSRELYRDLIALVHEEISALGYPPPRIALAGVNPHAGEGGQFGSEEEEVLRPAVDEALQSGVDVSGPWPADTCYQRAHAGEFDIVLAPYHDQGLIPVKLIAGGRSANVTLGLPFVRTSPDHGTGFDIAGQGIARTDGMESALEWALELVRRRRQATAAHR